MIGLAILTQLKKLKKFKGGIKMKKVEFEKVSDKEFEILVNDEKYGVLKFEEDFKEPVWFLWPDSIDDAVGYFDDLEETEEAIKEELEEDDEFREVRLADLGDFDVVQTDENSVELRRHSNVIGTNKYLEVTDEELEVLKTLISEIENEKESDEREDTIRSIKDEFFG